MDHVFDELVRRCAAGERVALCTVVEAKGSTPQAAGARMLLLESGQTIGTLGGGCVEAEVRQQALRIMSAGDSKLLTFKLDHDYGWDDGLICGGAVGIFLGEVPCCGAARHYAETIDPPAKLVIAGAGHVGQALARLAGEAGFRVFIIDDRADCASA